MSWLRAKSKRWTSWDQLTDNRVVIFIDFICLALFICFMALMLAISVAKLIVWMGM